MSAPDQSNTADRIARRESAIFVFSVARNQPASDDSNIDRPHEQSPIYRRYTNLQTECIEQLR